MQSESGPLRRVRARLARLWAESEGDSDSDAPPCDGPPAILVCDEGCDLEVDVDLDGDAESDVSGGRPSAEPSAEPSVDGDSDRPPTPTPASCAPASSAPAAAARAWRRRAVAAAAPAAAAGLDPDGLWQKLRERGDRVQRVNGEQVTARKI